VGVISERLQPANDLFFASNRALVPRVSDFLSLIGADSSRAKQYQNAGLDPSKIAILVPIASQATAPMFEEGLMALRLA